MKKKKKVTPSIVVMIVLVIALFTMTFSYFAKDNEGYRTISVVETSGTVVVVQDGREYQAYSGMKLQEGYELVTSGNSYVRLVLDGDKYIKVEAGSKMVFETLGMLGSGKTRLTLERGAMTSELVSPLKTDEEYVVNTPNAVLAVRGTFFRLDLKPTQDGELVADVVTYGGKVATQRVYPSGEIAQEEVLVDAGRKVCINMDTEKTTYVVEGVKLEEDEVIDNVEKITQEVKIEDIPDEDMVDIYYSAQNGHELFVTEKEAEEKIKDRDIKLEEYVPVYKKAEEVKKKQEGKIVETEVYADDSKPIAIVEDTQETQTEGNTVVSGIPLTDGDGGDDEVLQHIHEMKDEITTEATCTTAGIRTYTCECGYSYTEEIEATGHTETVGETADCHSKCSVCGEVLKAGESHSYTSEITTKATCTTKGIITYTCDCGYSYTEEVEAIGHTEVTGGTADCHSKCSVCEEVLKAGESHSYTSEITTKATCTTKGIITYTCDCGYSYTEEIKATGHTEVTGGTADCHSKCSTCGEILKDKNNHVYTSKITTKATCTAAGIKTYICDCGYSYTEGIEETGHTEVVGGTADCHIMCDICGETLENRICHSYTSTVTTKATCTTAGIRTYTCECGYSYTEEIKATGHTEIKGGTADCHSKCSICGEVLKAGGSHSYTSTVTTKATCTTAGIRKYTCDCGYSYTETIAATGHSKANKTASVTTCGNCSETWIDLNNTNFPDAVLLTYLSSNFDTDNDGVLIGTEITAVKTIDVSGTTTTDGGVTDLEGIEYLPELTSISCNYNVGITNVDLSQNNKLEIFSAINCTGITAIDANGCTALETVNLEGDTLITSLDFSNCASLTTIDTSTLTALQTIIVSGSGLINLDVAANIALTTLDAQNCLSLTSVTSEVKAKNSNALSSVDVSGCTNLVTLNLKYCSYVTELDLQTLENLEVLNVAYSGVTTYTGVTGMSFPNNPKLREVYANHLIVSSIDLSVNTDLEVFYNTSNTVTTTLDLTNNVNLRKLALGDLTQVTSLDLSQCTLLEYASIGGTKITSLTLANHSNLTTLELTNSSKLAQLEISNSPNLVTLKVDNCSALTSLDISEFTNLEVFNANASGIKTLSGSTTCLDFSANKKLKELQLNRLTSFSEIDLTENTKLEKFVYSMMPMTSVDLSNCVSLQNFQIDGSALTSLDFSNCPEIFRIISQNSSALTELNVSGCTKLMDARFAGSNNISSVDLTNAGSEVELGAYQEGKYLVFTVTAGTTTKSAIENATGWDSTIMSFA